MSVAFLVIKISKAIDINIFTKKCENFQSINVSEINLHRARLLKITNTYFFCVYFVSNNKLHARLLLKDNCAILGKHVEVNSFQCMTL